MAVPTKEIIEPLTFYMVNRMVEEARRNDVITRKLQEQNIPDTLPSTTAEDVVEHLTMQVANRIYFNNQGVICRVLFFKESQLPYQMRIENLQLEPDAKILRSEGFAASSPTYLEREIGMWRRRFDLSGDLLGNPLGVWAKLGKPEDIVHMAGTVNPVYCRYRKTTLEGPKFTGLGLVKDFQAKDGGNFIPLPEPPAFMQAHTNPFSIPTPWL